MQTLLGRKLMLQGGSATALHWAINSVKKGGIVSIVGVYGPIDTLVPIGNVVNKGLTIRANQASVKRLLPRLIEHVQNGVLDPKALITHRIPLEDVSDAYRIFSAKLDGCIKPVLLPPSARNLREEPPWNTSTSIDPVADQGLGRGRRSEERPDLPDEEAQQRGARGLQLGAPAAAAGRRRGPAFQRAAERLGRLRHLDAALGAERHDPPLRLQIQRIELRALAAADAGGPGQRGGRGRGDLARGHVPNIFAELGWKAEWKHNRASLVGRVLVGAVLVSAAVGMVAATRARADTSRRARTRL